MILYLDNDTMMSGLSFTDDFYPNVFVSVLIY